jgi:hypothetical protein
MVFENIQTQSLVVVMAGITAIKSGATDTVDTFVSTIWGLSMAIGVTSLTCTNRVISRLVFFIFFILIRGVNNY